MGQMSLFSRTEIAGMRDRTKARNYSAERDEFRRDHERRRAFGLQRRHATKLRRLQQERSAAAATSRNEPTRPVAATRRPPGSPPAPCPRPGISQVAKAPTPKLATPHSPTPP